MCSVVCVHFYIQRKYGGCTSPSDGPRFEHSYYHKLRKNMIGGSGPLEIKKGRDYYDQIKLAAVVRCVADNRCRLELPIPSVMMEQGYQWG